MCSEVKAVLDELVKVEVEAEVDVQVEVAASEVS